MVPGGLHRLPRVAPGSEAVARLAEPALEDRLQDLQHRLLDHPVHHGRHAQCPDPALRLGDVHRAHFPRQVASRQQRRSHRRPVSLQPRLQVLHPHAVGTGRTLVAQHSLVGPPHVAALDHLLHEHVGGHLRFRSPPRRRGRLGTVAGRSRVPPAASSTGRPRACTLARLCFIAVHRDHESYSRSITFGPSVRGAPTMASADFWPTIPAPLNAGSPIAQQARSPRVLRTHLHAYACRIYVVAFRASTGLRRCWPPHPTTPPPSASCSSGQRFAFGFLQIRSHPRHPCRSADGSPCRARRGLPPPSECALPGAPKKKRPGQGPGRSSIAAQCRSNPLSPCGGAGRRSPDRPAPDRRASRSKAQGC